MKQRLASTDNHLSTAVTLLLSGYSFDQVAEQTAASPAELDLLQELLNAKLLMPQPSVHYRPDGHIDIVAEYEELIPVFKGQVHVAILSASLTTPTAKATAAPDLVKDYSIMLVNLAKLHQLAGIAPTPPQLSADEPTLKELLAPVPTDAS
jgi:hypothetical protein